MPRPLTLAEHQRRYSRWGWSAWLARPEGLTLAEEPKHQLPNGSYPISNCSHVSDAWHLRGHSEDYSKAKVSAYIRRVARQIGCPVPKEEGAEAAQPGVRGVHSSRPVGSMPNPPDGKAAEKKSKLDVNYRDGTGSRKCGNCRHYAAGSCELVAGRIDAGMLCDLYAARPAARVAAVEKLTKERLAKFYELGDVAQGGEGEGRSWAPVFPEGKFQHPEYGELDFSAGEIAKYVANFDSRVRKIDICVDVDHKNEEAVGWVKRLQFRPGVGLFALVEWNRLGAEKLADKRYRYISPQFGEYLDEETGDLHENVLVALTITNFPFLKKMPAIQLSERESAQLEQVELLLERAVETGRRRLARAGLLRRASAFAAGEKGTSSRRRLAEGLAILRELREHERRRASGASVASNQGGARPKMSVQTKPGDVELSELDDDEAMSELDDDSELDDGDVDADDGDQTAKAKKAKKAKKAMGVPSDDSKADDDSEAAELYDDEDLYDDESMDQHEEKSRMPMPTAKAADPKAARSLAEANRQLAELRAEMASAQRELRLSAVRDQTRRLADPKLGRIAFPKPVVDEFKKIALGDKSTGDLVFRILSLVKKHGLVELGERGRGARGDDERRDPIDREKIRTASDGRKVIGEGIVTRAMAYAKEHGLKWDDPEDKMAAMQAATEDKSLSEDDGYGVAARTLSDEETD